MNRSSQCRKHSPRENPLGRKRRVLKVACQVFAKRGFGGTRIREICKLAGVNIALVWYYFGNKEGLFEAVQTEARQRLSERSNCDASAHRNISPERQLQGVIESLFARLTGDSAWVAQLVARELADEARTSQGTVSEGFRGDLILLESAMRDAIGSQADANTLRLAALNVLSQCVFLCAARRTLTRLSPNLEEQALRSQRLVSHLTRFSLRGLTGGAHVSMTRPKATGTDILPPLQEVPMGKLAPATRG
jgi:TetR/AcrR family transcriptional regulator, regulator of cefoperazone and chloramphenicol sensitivity